MVVESRLLRNIDKLKDYFTSSDLMPLFLEADTYELLQLFPDNCIDCVITSPPYWGHRAYANGGIGLEEKWEDYINKLLQNYGIEVKDSDVTSGKDFGMNWKMTAKTILMQLHHKIHTFEHLSKHLVLVTQDCLIEYMQGEFSFEHIQDARLGNPRHFHSYSLLTEASGYRLQLTRRWSTDANGIAQGLGLQTSPRVELEVILRQIEERLPQSTLLSVGQRLPVSTHEDVADDS
jgi:hypothetical protein